MLIVLISFPVVFALLNLLPVSKMFRVGMFLAASLVHLAGVISFWYARPSPELGGYLVLDPLGLIFLTTISSLFVIVSIFMLGYFRHEQRNARIFISSLLFLLSMMTLVGVSYHFGLLWVAIETTTLFSASLISFHRSKQSLEATWKYLLVCSVGIALALLGTFFLAISAHDLQTLMLSDLLNGASSLTENWLKLSVIFLLVGYGCKMGLAPMHSWKPEAYGQSTGMIAVLMAGGLTQCSFLALVRVNQICARTGLVEFFASMLFVAGALSLIVGAIFMLGQNNLKRALAYSSVEHMGILVIGLGLGGIGLLGALLHMITNALAKAVMFLTAGSIAQKYGSCRTDDVRGVLSSFPVTGLLLILSLLAGVGMFPFATFHSELMILYSAVASKHYWLVVVFVVSLSLIFIGLARIVLSMVYGTPTEPVLRKKENFLMNSAVAIAVLLLIGIGLWMPSLLQNVLREAAVMIGV